MHPIFMTALRRPDLVFDHAANYAELVKDELAAAGRSLILKAASAAVALVALLLALGLTGIAIMLGCVHARFHWALVIVPGTAWVLAVVGALVAAKAGVKDEIEDIKSQLAADVEMLRTVKESSDD